MESIVRLSEAAKRAGVSQTALRAWIAAGEFPEPRVRGGASGKVVGVLESELAEWFRTRPRVGEIPGRRELTGAARRVRA